MAALRAQLCAVQASGKPRTIVLQGAGAHFCTGGAQHQDAGMRLIPPQLAPTAAVVADLGDGVMMMQRMRAPVLCVLHGKLIGGGVALALNSDWRVSTGGIALNHGNLPRNMNPITNFSRSLGHVIGRGMAHALHLEDIITDSPGAEAIGITQVVEHNTVNARECVLGLQLSIAIGAVSSSCGEVGMDFLETEDLLNATVGCQTAELAANSHGGRTSTVRSGSYQLITDEQLLSHTIASSRLDSVPSGYLEARIGAYGLNFR